MASVVDNESFPKTMIFPPMNIIKQLKKLFSIFCWQRRKNKDKKFFSTLHDVKNFSLSNDRSKNSRFKLFNAVINKKLKTKNKKQNKKKNTKQQQ